MELAPLLQYSDVVCLLYATLVLVIGGPFSY